MSDVASQVEAEILKSISDADEQKNLEASNTEEVVKEKVEPKQANDSGDDDEAGDEDLSLVTKTAKNAIHRREKKINKLNAYNQQLSAEIERLRAQVQQPPASKQEKPQDNVDPNRPREDDYDHYGDYLKADAIYTLKQDLAKEKEAEAKAAKESEAEQAVNKWREDRAAHADAKLEEVQALYPQIDDIWAENGDIALSLPQEIRDILLDADNPPAAFVALVQDDVLESLANMTLAQAARAIAKAEIRGEQLIKASSNVTKAPVPMGSVKGSSKSGQDPSSMSVDELMREMKKNR